jgi:hypothetical protein
MSKRIARCLCEVSFRRRRKAVVGGVFARSTALLKKCEFTSQWKTPRSDKQSSLLYRDISVCPNSYQQWPATTTSTKIDHRLIIINNVSDVLVLIYSSSDSIIFIIFSYDNHMIQSLQLMYGVRI